MFYEVQEIMNVYNNNLIFSGRLRKASRESQVW